VNASFQRGGYWEDLLRLLDLEYRDPYRNTAVDEALLIAAERDLSQDTVRFWRNQNAVVIGYSQNPKTEADLEACKRYGTSIVKRSTGGGAVYQDYGNLNWTFVMRRDNHLMAKTKGVPEVFRTFSAPILEGMKALGIQGEFKPPNIILVGDQKISGMAAYVKRKTILCHGTLLVNTNLYILKSVLRIMKNKVTTLQHELNTEISMTRVRRAIIAGLDTVYGMKISREKPSREELEIVDELYEKKYSKEEWNLK
jgi:lipoate-protein ligase A